MFRLTQFCFTDYRIKNLPYKEVNGKISYVVFQKENYYRKVPKGKILFIYYLEFDSFTLIL